MKYNFFLRNPKNRVSSIEIIVCIKGKYFKVPTGESLPVSQWDKRYKCSKTDDKSTNGQNINERLAKLQKKVNEAIERAKSLDQLPDNSTFRKWILEDKSNNQEEEDNTFIKYLENYVNRTSMAESTKKKYITTINKLKEYGIHTHQKLNFTDINIVFYESFKKWFYEQYIPIPKNPDYEGKKYEKRRYSKNYFGSVVKIIKKGLKRSYDDGLHTNIGFNHGDFKVDQEPTDSIYLSIDEINAIRNFQITDEVIKKEYPNLTNGNLQRKVKSYNVVRDIFLIGCFTALRVSDLKRLSKINFNDKFLFLTTKKTNQQIIVPLHPIVRQIISDFDFNMIIYEQKINQQIKKIAKLAGITEPILITRTEGERKVQRIYPKYELITTHTARRSGATNMFKAGIPSLSIMKITGHRTEASFMKYLRISVEENAELLAQHSFFNK